MDGDEAVSWVPSEPSGRGLCFWYQATRMARASASCRYRMGHLAERLRGATTVIYGRPPRRTFGRAEVVVVVRPFLDPYAKRVLEQLRRRGARLVADFDDLLFSGDPAEYPLVLTDALSRAAGAERIVHYREGLRHFDAFTVATEPLREYLRAAAPKASVQVVPNGVSPLWIRQGRALYRPWQPGDPKTIRFLPGSPSHDADFETIAQIVGQFLQDQRDVSLEIVGPLEFSRAGFPEGRVAQLERVPYAELPRLLASSWVTLAPLAETEFNRCKSALKFLESAAFATPCIASPNPDVERHADGGVLIARDRVAWREALERLLSDEVRMRRGRRGRHYVDEHGTSATGARVFSDWIRTWQRA